MTVKLPRATAKEVSKIVEKLGFTLCRQSGSHKIYKNSEGKRLTIPYHSGKILHPKLLKSIIKDCNLLTRAEYTLHGRWCHAELDSASIDPETSSG